MDKLDSTPYVQATTRLAEGLARYRLVTADAQIRDGLVQRSEFTYEISQKILKRYLESVSATPGAYDAMAFADIIRSGNEQGLLRSDWGTWKQYREMRGQTSHTYDEGTALKVVFGIRHSSARRSICSARSKGASRRESRCAC